MRLYRATGAVPLLVYFLAEDDEDALTKAPVALWEGEWEGSTNGSITVHTVRPPMSLTEVEIENWGDKIPHLVPDGMDEWTCREFLQMQNKLREIEEKSRQVEFSFMLESGPDDG